MLKSRAVVGALIVGAVAVASMFAASPAAAAVLPSGQRITVIDNQDNQYFVADPATAGLTEVGNGGVNDEYAYVEGVDVDDAGLGYAVGTYYNSGPIGGFVQTADANTGTVGAEVAVYFPDGGGGVIYPDACSGVDYTAGVVLIACSSDDEGDDDTTYVGEVDPATGELSLTYVLSNVNDEYSAYLPVLSLALNPLTGDLYFGSAYLFGEGQTAFTLYRFTAAGVVYVNDTEGPLVGLDFDRGGQLWTTTYLQFGESDEAGPALATVDLVTAEFPFAEYYTWSDEEELFLDFTSITVWGPPALAATGATVSPLAPAVAAAGILLLGSLLAAGTLVLRRRTADL
jgi:hypothetical protein